MGESPFHQKLCEEKGQGALHELKEGRHSNVADMALKAAEQAIESAAADEGYHFHTEPHTAHARRRRWLQEQYPDLLVQPDILWGACGDLGYDGLDGDRAREAVEAMEEIVDGLKR